MMGVPIAKYQTIPLGEVEDGVDVRRVVGRDGRRWRTVDVCDVVGGAVDGDGSGDDFKMRIGEIEIDGSEGDGVVDDKGDSSSSSATRTILTQDVVTWNIWSFVPRLQFGFLNGSNFDAVLVKEVAEPLRRSSEAVAVPLKEGLRGSRIWRARVRVNSGAEKEDEDEEAAEADVDATSLRGWPAKTRECQLASHG